MKVKMYINDSYEITHLIAESRRELRTQSTTAISATEKVQSTKMERQENKCNVAPQKIFNISS